MQDHRHCTRWPPHGACRFAACSILPYATIDILDGLGGQRAVDPALLQSLCVFRLGPTEACNACRSCSTGLVPNWLRRKVFGAASGVLSERSTS